MIIAVQYANLLRDFRTRLSSCSHFASSKINSAWRVSVRIPLMIAARAVVDFYPIAGCTPLCDQKTGPPEAKKRRLHPAHFFLRESAGYSLLMRTEATLMRSAREHNAGRLLSCSRLTDGTRVVC